MVVGFIIISIVAVIFLGIGVSCYKSQEAVGFFTGVKPPVVKNIEKYNRAVSMIWFATAFVLEILGVLFLFLEQNSPVFVGIIFAVVMWSIGIAVVYLKIEAKYKK